MNLLLTGANGFFGKIIIKTLVKEYQIYGLSRSSDDYRVCLDKEIPSFHHSFGIVIHAAGKAHSLPKKDSEKKQFHQVNVIGTENLLKGLGKIEPPKQFVFISSVSVYGQECGKGINEENELEASDPYGLSKIDAEVLVIEWCKKNNVVCTILRLPLLVGINPPGNLGAMIKAINKGYYFNIARGKAKKSMVVATDVASFISVVAPIGGIYNLTDGIDPSFSELSAAISKKKYLSLPLGLAKVCGKLGDILGDKAPITSLKVQKITSDLTFDDSKARRLLNWKPESVLDYVKREKLS